MSKSKVGYNCVFYWLNYMLLVSTVSISIYFIFQSIKHEFPMQTFPRVGWHLSGLIKPKLISCVIDVQLTMPQKLKIINPP